MQKSIATPLSRIIIVFVLECSTEKAQPLYIQQRPDVPFVTAVLHC